VPSQRHATDGVFRCPGLDVDAATGEIAFHYELADGRRTLRFTETVHIDPPASPPKESTVDTLRRVLELAYLAAGTSYYKVWAPPVITVDTPALSAPAADFVRAAYTDGLAEFAFRNDLPHVFDVTVQATAAERRTPRTVAGPPLVPVGGGKDSIVTLEALRRAGHAPVGFAVNPNQIIADVLARPGGPTRHARRRLDPRMFELNRAGALNGHIPVTAINSLLAVATAVLHGLGPAVMSNESSASVPNLEWRGRSVNHQWSKGLHAERLLVDALAAQAGLADAYFSLLRPLSEVHIAREFARLDGYDDVVTSCNRAFRLTGPTGGRWCGDCDKCRFVFLALAPFTGRDRLKTIFGVDLLAEESQLPGFRELVGLGAYKPLECVGDVDEALVALRLLTRSDEWRDAAVVRRLAAEVPGARWPDDAATAATFAGAGEHLVPDRFQPVLRSLTPTT
jgi:hypothetical protein